VEEVADLTYHLLVLLALHGLRPADIEAELARRHLQRQGEDRELTSGIAD